MDSVGQVSMRNRKISVLSKDSHEDILSPLGRAELRGICSISFAFLSLSMKEMQMLSDANDPGLQILARGAGRIAAYQLRASAVLPEDLHLVPRTHVKKLTTNYHSSSRGLVPPFDLYRHPCPPPTHTVFKRSFNS